MHQLSFLARVSFFSLLRPLLQHSAFLNSLANEIRKRSGRERKEKSETEMGEIRELDKRSHFDLGHPLLDRVAESFVRASGIGAIRAVTRQVYFTVVEGYGAHDPSDGNSGKKNKFSDLEGENCKKSLEAMVKGTGKESFQWGMAAGIYSGLTYGLREARGTHDWKNSAVAGAVTGAALALTLQDASHQQIVECAVTGAALSAAANLLSGIS